MTCGILKEIASELVLILACGAVLAAAQAPQAPVFRGGVKIVTLDVTAVDDAGRPVAGLTPQDFTATINGAAARVATIDFQQFGRDRIGDTPQLGAGAPAVSASPQQPGASRGPQTFLLLFDDLSFVPGSGKGLQFAGERMLSRLDVADLVGMTTTSGLETPLAPTRDRTALGAAIKRLAGRMTDSADPYFISALEVSEIARGLRGTLDEVVRRECGLPDPGGICANRIAAHARRLTAMALRQKAGQMNALRDAIEVMARVPAPRVVVFLSAGISVDGSPQDKDAVEQLSSLAAKSGVQLYALFDEPEAINMKDDSPARTRARYAEGTFLMSGLQSAAVAAGGYAFKVIGQPDLFFSRIVTETSAVYRLGIELPASITDTTNLRTTVKVGRSGVHVRSTGRALAGEASGAPLTREDAIKMALEHGREASAVPVAVSTRVRKDSSGGLQVMVDARIPGDVPAPIAAVFGLVDANGKVVLNTQRDVPVASGPEHQILFSMKAAAGDYRLRFVAADGADRIGSTEVPVAARLTRAGPFELSDVLTVFHRLGGAQAFSASESIPASAMQLTATIELYPDSTVTSGATTSVRMVLSQDGSATPLTEVTATLTSANDRWVASADLPLANVTSGRYTLKCEVLHNGGVVGTKSISLRQQ